MRSEGVLKRKLHEDISDLLVHLDALGVKIRDAYILCPYQGTQKVVYFGMQEDPGVSFRKELDRVESKRKRFIRFSIITDDDILQIARKKRDKGEKVTGVKLKKFAPYLFYSLRILRLDGEP